MDSNSKYLALFYANKKLEEDGVPFTKRAPLLGYSEYTQWAEDLARAEEAYNGTLDEVKFNKAVEKSMESIIDVVKSVYKDADYIDVSMFIDKRDDSGVDLYIGFPDGSSLSINTADNHRTGSPIRR
jgi:hypothetical protein